jgi:hypothetical protein
VKSVFKKINATEPLACRAQGKDPFNQFFEGIDVNALKKLKIGTQLSHAFGVLTALMLILAGITLTGIASIAQAVQQPGPVVPYRRAGQRVLSHWRAPAGWSGKLRSLNPGPIDMLNFKGMRFPIDVILVCIRWYAAYPLSYRHLEEMMEERGVSVDHSSINR